MYDLDRLDAVHHQMEENELSQAMDEIGYQKKSYSMRNHFRTGKNLFG